MRYSLILAFLFLSGCGTGSFLVTPVANPAHLQEVQAEPGSWGGGKIAIIEVEGTLINARTSGLFQSGDNPMNEFTQKLDQAEQDHDVKAVVLRINSPGGTVSTSDAMYDLIDRFKAKTHKPVVASIQEVGASGAYYVSCAADQIVAQPTSVVGSIGVIFESVNLSGTMAKLGISAEAIKSGPLKDMGSPYRPLAPDARAVMQSMVDEYYARFVQIVTSNRHLKDSPILKMLTDGRVFSGEKAKELGLVDQCGLLSDAIDLARKLAHAPKAEAIMYKHAYGYKGSIYADSDMPQPQANVTKLELPGGPWLPAGFYFMWNP